jgi:MYXO-CTERM domain-containing protein
LQRLLHFGGVCLTGIGLAGAAFGIAAPEIDPASGANALALLSGALLVLRARRRK